MDIYAAKKHADKLLKYARELDSSEVSKMYQPSKDKLIEIQKSAGEVVFAISKVLGTSVDLNTTGKYNSRDVIHLLSDMQNEIDCLRKLNTTSSDNEDKSEASNSDNLSTEDRRLAMIEYRAHLHTLSKSTGPYSAATECACLIWRWFETRFIESFNQHKLFKYNIRRLPSWIQAIVIVYGKHLMLGDIDEFIADFNSWCSSILYSKDALKYAVPYEVYKFDVNPQPSDLSLSAVVLWDVLLDMGLDKLVKDDETGLYLSSDSVYQICLTMNPEILDSYSNYKFNPSVSHDCNLDIK